MSLPNRAKREPQAPSDRLAYHGRHGVEMKHVHEKLECRWRRREGPKYSTDLREASVNGSLKALRRQFFL